MQKQNTNNNNNNKQQTQGKRRRMFYHRLSCGLQCTHSRQRVQSPQNLRPDQTLSDNLLLIHDT